MAEELLRMLTEILAAGTLLIHVGLVLILVLLLGAYLFDFQRLEQLKASLFEILDGYYRELAFLQAFVAVSSSLVMSKFLGLPPCELCWYQRILIFPSLVILGVAVFLDKEGVADYVVPLMVMGIPVSAYHYIIQFSSVSAGCSTAVSCSTTQVVEFGYISIPMMSLTFFLTTAGLMWFEYR